MPKLDIHQDPPVPEHPRPILCIGAGGIVHDAHLPAYRKAGYPVWGLMDVDRGKAEKLADAFDVPNVFDDLGAAIAAAPSDIVYDVAVPAAKIMSILPHLPDGAPVLMQKPMGDDLSQADDILDTCRSKGLTAAVNFQMRFAPYIVAARDMIDRGLLGDIHDVEVRMTVWTPWHLWKFLFDLDRVEILYHSIHYIDLIRSFLGDPRGVYAKTVRHPQAQEISNSRSTIILDYGDMVRANIETNHGHGFGSRHQEAYVKFEGTKGAIWIKAGLNLNYPEGEPDVFEYALLEGEPGGDPEWIDVPLAGSWFPDAFMGSMGSLQRFLEGSTDVLPTKVEDAYKTMAVVEAAYRSSAEGATPIPYRS